MNGIGTASQGNADDLVHVEVGVFEVAIAQWIGFIGHFHMPGVGIIVSIYCNGFFLEFMDGPGDAYRNFSAVGDKYFIDHRAQG